MILVAFCGSIVMYTCKTIKMHIWRERQTIFISLNLIKLKPWNVNTMYVCVCIDRCSRATEHTLRTRNFFGFFFIVHELKVARLHYIHYDCGYNDILQWHVHKRNLCLRPLPTTIRSRRSARFEKQCNLAFSLYTAKWFDVLDNWSPQKTHVRVV